MTTTRINIGQVDIATPSAREALNVVAQRSDHDRTLLLVRLCGEPIGKVLVDSQSECDLARVRATLRHSIGVAESRHGHAAFENVTHCRWRVDNDDARASAEPISVIICTSGRPQSLRRTLSTLIALDYPHYEVVVVDNTADDRLTRQIVSEVGNGNCTMRCVHESRAGLSRARNAGVRAARFKIVAFTDDDVLVDSGWLLAAWRALNQDAEVGVVTGPVLPAELETAAQELFERQGGHSKGRDLTRVILRPDIGQNPLFPLPPFAVGANMIFRREVLEAVGCFDMALGAGTPARASEDTHAVCEVMLGGNSVAYEPAALVWHFHRREMSELLSQRGSYGRGVGAFYMALIVRDPLRLVGLLKLLPSAYRAVRHATPLGVAPEASDSSSSISLKEMLRGPVAYLIGRWSLRMERDR